jgi:hypothetical protein
MMSGIAVAGTAGRVRELDRPEKVRCPRCRLRNSLSVVSSAGDRMVLQKAQHGLGRP